MNQKNRIFISYVREDGANVGVLYDRLKSEGFNPWMDIKDILPGEDWKTVLRSAIKDAVIFLACISVNSVSKRGTMQVELKEALELWKEKLATDIYLIPIKLDNSDVPDELSRFQWVDLNSSDGFSRLIKALQAGLARQGGSVQSQQPLPSTPTPIVPTVTLRSTPRANLSVQEVIQMIRDRDYFTRGSVTLDYLIQDFANLNGTGISNNYQILPGGDVVLDKTTGLHWQRGGSPKIMKHAEVNSYLGQINGASLGGFSDWRLPTLDEAMSILLKKKQTGGPMKFIDLSVFHGEPEEFWTSDGLHQDFVENVAPDRVWAVHVNRASAGGYPRDLEFAGVRAVRSGY